VEFAFAESGVWSWVHLPVLHMQGMDWVRRVGFCVNDSRHRAWRSGKDKAVCRMTCSRSSGLPRFASAYEYWLVGLKQCKDDFCTSANISSTARCCEPRHPCVRMVPQFHATATRPFEDFQSQISVKGKRQTLGVTRRDAGDVGAMTPDKAICATSGLTDT
jgi:hypothetical protein